MNPNVPSSRIMRGAPPMLSALDLAHRIEAGDLTAATVVELCAESIAQREGEIGAFTVLDIAAARQAAAAQRHEPLCGLPAAIKDIYDTAQFPTQYGSPIYAGYRPRADAAMVAQLRRAGGILIGKTVTTEFAFLQPAGTRNPCNPAHTPGGSSSGSAAAVAAGMVPIALGSQTAGSTIRPASYCGIAGFKPSFKLLPTVGMKCFSWSLDTVGLFAAGIADVAFAASALSGRELRIDKVPPAAPRIALVRSAQWPEASDDMQDAFVRAARAAEVAGARVHDLELPAIFSDAFEAQMVIQDFESYRALAYEFDHHRDQLSPLLRAHFERAATIQASTYDEARRTTRRARQSFADLMVDSDVILTPSAPGAAPVGLATTGKPTFNRLWTLLGTPCINVPGLRDAHGLPLGMQIVGRFARDHIALEAAAFLERVLVHHA
jgi:Asp-tRNA(Asn)/Glu-tRNA(Gln) amidotransferase A subunit family amidase